MPSPLHLPPPAFLFHSLTFCPPFVFPPFFFPFFFNFFHSLIFFPGLKTLRFRPCTLWERIIEHCIMLDSPLSCIMRLIPKFLSSFALATLSIFFFSFPLIFLLLLPFLLYSFSFHFLSPSPSPFLSSPLPYATLPFFSFFFDFLSWP